MFQCHACGGIASREDFVNEVFTIDGRRVLVEQIPAEICDCCDEATFSRVTTEKVRSLIHGGGHPIAYRYRCVRAGVRFSVKVRSAMANFGGKAGGKIGANGSE